MKTTDVALTEPIEVRELWTCTLCRKPEQIWDINAPGGPVTFKQGVHPSCLERKRRGEKSAAMYQAAMLRGAAAMIEAGEKPIFDRFISEVVSAAQPRQSIDHMGFQDPDLLPRMPEDLR